MNIEYIRYQVAPTERDSFIAAWREALALLGRAPSVISRDLVQNSDQPDKFVVRIEWQERQSQRDYVSSPDFATFLGLIKPFHSALVSMEFHDPVALSAS